MKAAQNPENERERLEELLSLAILDTPSEPEYDDLTELAASICGVPIALISLVDSDRQWFKSKVGLGAPQTDRDISFCGHAIHQSEIFEVQDSLKDSRFADNPLVTGDPKVIFYAGAPLETRQGLRIGTLCVIDNKPGNLSETQKRQLLALSRQVVSQLELRRKNSQLKAAMDEVKKQAETLQSHQARMIQNAKMVSLGQMAGGIAHEINNPLAVLVGLNRRMLRLLDAEGPSALGQLKAEIEKSDMNIRRIVKIVNGMLKCSREEKVASSGRTDLLDTVNLAVGMVAEKFQSHGVSIKVGGDESVDVQMSQTQLSQVLLNLLSNSFDAVLESRIKHICIDWKQDLGKVRLMVKDSGTGIQPENFAKVLDPFFTTKPVGKGTGLGLSISRNICEASDGSLEILSSGSSGTEIELTLPMAS